MKIFLMLVALSALSVTSWAENFSGRWTFEMPGRGGQVQKMLLDLNQNGNVMTGTLSAGVDFGSASPVNNAIWGGKIDGNTITFYVWRGNDRPWKQSYKGTLSGDRIVFTVTDASHMTISFFGPTGGTTESGSVQVTAKQSN